MKKRYFIIVLGIIILIGLTTHLLHLGRIEIFQSNITIKETKFVHVNTLFYQGLATDGNYWYFSHKNCLFKVENFDKIIITLYPAIPNELAIEDYDHLGDIDIYEGIIYAPLEDKYYEKPIVALYQTDNLRYIDYIGPLDQKHLPWVAVSQGKIYSSEFNNVNEIYVYNLKGQRIASIKLNKTLNRVQGGAFINENQLVISTDDGGDGLYIVDIRTGNVTLICNIKTNYEGEGIEYFNGKLYFLIGSPAELPNRLYILNIDP